MRCEMVQKNRTGVPIMMNHNQFLSQCGLVEYFNPVFSQLCILYIIDSVVKIFAEELKN